MENFYEVIDYDLNGEKKQRLEVKNWSLFFNQFLNIPDYCRLANSGAVYGFIDEYGDPLYIGTTNNLYVRIKSHFKTSYSNAQNPRLASVLKEVIDKNRVIYLYVYRHKKCLSTERTLINEIKPPCNVFDYVAENGAVCLNDMNSIGGGSHE